MIVWLASYPRSGNTLFRLVVHRSYGLRTYSLYEEGVERTIIGELVGRGDSDLSPEAMAARPELYVVKIHDLPRDDYPAIYLVRDGRDALVSYAHYILSFEREHWKHYPGGFESTLRELIGGDPLPFGSWSRNVMAWSGHRGTAVVKFEDLVEDPVRVVRGAMSAVGCGELPRRSAVLPLFEELNRLVPEFFRRGQIGGWRNEVSAELHELFWKYHSEAMHRMGYTR